MITHHARRLGAVILAGGRGTRLGVLTRERPKPLIPLLGEPVLSWQLRALADLGIDEVVVSIGHLAEQFRAGGLLDSAGEGAAYDGERLGSSMRVQFAQEDRPLGTGGGLRLAAGMLPAAIDTMLVLNGDQLTEHDLSGQLSAHARSPEANGTLHVRHVTDARSFGLVALDESGTITAFREKPAEPVAGLVNAGTYVLDRSLVHRLPLGAPASLERDGFTVWAHEGRLRAFIDDSWGQDLGTPDGLIAAHAQLTGSDSYADRSAWVHHTATLRDSVVLPGARVGAHAHLSHTVVDTNATIGAGADLTECVVGDRVDVPEGTRAVGREFG